MTGAAVAIGVVIGATLIGVLVGVVKLVGWVLDTSTWVQNLKWDVKMLGKSATECDMKVVERRELDDKFHALVVDVLETVQARLLELESPEPKKDKEPEDGN